MSDMTLQDKLEALRQLGAVEVVNTGIVFDGGKEGYYAWRVGVNVSFLFRSACLSIPMSGRTKQEAVELYWEWITSIRHPDAILIHAHTPDERRVYWFKGSWVDESGGSVPPPPPLRNVCTDPRREDWTEHDLIHRERKRSDGSWEVC